jgi:translation initiation factor 2D
VSHITSLPPLHVLTIFYDLSTTAQYTLPELKVIVNAYVTAHDLVNPRERQYVSLDALLGSVLAGKDGTQVEFLKRGEVAERLVEKMQPWYEIDVDGKESVPK